MTMKIMVILMILVLLNQCTRDLTPNPLTVLRLVVKNASQ